MQTILLLTISNIFMTFAWYGHLKYKDSPLWMAILVSWGIAFVEYCFQVPANRIGHYEFTAAQLKTIQEVITLVVFCVFSVLYLREPLKWNYLVGFGMMIGAVFIILRSGELCLQKRKILRKQRKHRRPLQHQLPAVRPKISRNSASFTWAAPTI